MNREVLERPFGPDQIKRREGAFGDVLDYVEGSTVIQRLNEIFESEWHFEILDHHVYDKEVVVLGKLTAQGIGKCQFGKSKITRTRDEKMEVSLGDDLKAAATDSLKKCATLFGIGLHLYFDQPGESNRTDNRKRANGNGGRAPSDGPSDNGRLTAKQLSAIFAMAKRKGWSNNDVREFTKEMFNKLPDFLSRKEGFAVIDYLQGGSHA